MSRFDKKLHTALLDRALGFAGRVGPEGTTVPAELDAESYERAAAALHLALLPPLLPVPDATRMRLEAEAGAFTNEKGGSDAGAP